MWILPFSLTSARGWRSEWPCFNGPPLSDINWTVPFEAGFGRSASRSHPLTLRSPASMGPEKAALIPVHSFQLAGCGFGEVRTIVTALLFLFPKSVIMMIAIYNYHYGYYFNIPILIIILCVADILILLVISDSSGHLEHTRQRLD